MGGKRKERFHSLKAKVCVRLEGRASERKKKYPNKSGTGQKKGMECLVKEGDSSLLHGKKILVFETKEG